MLWPSSLSSPAIVTSAAVRPFPRWLLWLFCVVYVAAGYVGRGPWKAEDITTLGVMLQLADGSSPNWWQPGLFGQALDNPDGALLPYWLGAWLIQWTSPWLDPVWAARVPFVLALSLVLYWTWHSTFQLALLPAAQPVTFAFGGQAAPVDYARALADSSLMALMACLGLAQLSHEASPDLFQLLAVSALLYASSLSARGRSVDRRLTLTWLGGLVTLSLSGRPYWAVLVAIALPLAHWAWANCVPTALHHPQHRPSQESLRQLPHWAWLGMLVTLSLWGLQQQWTAAAPNPLWLDEVWRVPPLASFGKLLLWFTWPVWPLVCWTVWHWRRHWMLHHIGIPLAFALGGLVLSVGYGGHDRVLMLALPALATLAAFALPTLSRSLSALIDWFSLLFFSICAALIWIIWLAMMTGVPAKPAANVARLAPGFVPSFELLGFVVALLGTVAWLGVLYWRTSRAPAVLWKSLVLPATGTLLCWLLLMSVWLPLLDHSRSYAFLTQRLQHLIHTTSTTSTSAMPDKTTRCVLMHQLNSAQQAGLLYHITHANRGADRALTPIGLHISRPLSPDTTAPACAYGLSHVGTSPPNDGYTWRPSEKLYRLTDNKEGLQLYQRLAPVGSSPAPLRRDD